MYQVIATGQTNGIAAVPAVVVGVIAVSGSAVGSGAWVGYGPELPDTPPEAGFEVVAWIGGNTAETTGFSH